MGVVVSHTYETAMFYLEQFGMELGPQVKIATRAEELLQFGPPTTFVYVNADNHEPDREVIRQLHLLEMKGCEVD